MRVLINCFNAHVSGVAVTPHNKTSVKKKQNKNINKKQLLPCHFPKGKEKKKKKTVKKGND